MTALNGLNFIRNYTANKILIIRLEEK